MSTTTGEQVALTKHETKNGGVTDVQNMTDCATTSTTMKEQLGTPTLQRRIPENLQKNPTGELHRGNAAELCGENEMKNPQATCMVAEKRKNKQQPAPRHYQEILLNIQIRCTNTGTKH